MPDQAAGLPSIAEVVGQLFSRAAREDRPLLVAIAERMAADRYRGWAESVSDSAARGRLLACADREEEIARRVEALHPEAVLRQEALRTRFRLPLTIEVQYFKPPE